MKQYNSLILITFLGFLLRFIGLGDRPLWVDEAIYAFLIQDGATQEFTTVFIGWLFGLRSEFELRLMSAITGTLTIPAIYFVLKNKDTAIYASMFVAVFPLFVFWSRMARPYSFAGLFVVLGWRYAWCYVVAIATTPIALIGVRVLNQKRTVLISALIGGVLLYFLREDSGRDWTIQQALTSSRWFYLPTLAGILYFFDYGVEYGKYFLLRKLL